MWNLYEKPEDAFYHVLENELLLIKEDMKKQKYYIDLLLEKMDCISVDAELPIAKKVEI